MFNSEIEAHRVANQCCKGRLEFDAEACRQRTLAFEERLKCTNCKYVSKYYKLYEEIKTGKRGRRAAKINVGLQLGLMNTQISNTGAVQILAHSNMIPPHKKSMQVMSNKIGEKVKSLNMQNMHSIRQSLKDENAKCGNKNPSEVNVEGDSCYNNPLFSSDNTPFQAGTVVTTTMCENNTTNKKVIGVFVGVKICKTASTLKNQGVNVTCPNHPGHCSANLDPTQPIGDEAKWNENVTREINKDLSIAHFTGDGDSKGHNGVDKGQTDKVTHLKDVRHLANSLKREINKAPFSRKMFDGKLRTNLKNRFAMSVKARCLAELKMTHKILKGDLNKIKNKIPKIIDAIIMCFKGYCGSMCKRHSLVCGGNFRQAKNYLPSNIKLKMTATDEKLLSECIKVLLSAESLTKTKFLSSTQKCEAVNRAYQACMPKSVTFSRNCHGRIHSKILKSIMVLLNQL